MNWNKVFIFYQGAKYETKMIEETKEKRALNT